MEVDMSAKLRTSAELVTIGEALPEAEGLGAVTLMLREIEIECYPDDLVASIDVDLSTIKTPDDVIHVRDLVIPKGIEVLTDPDMVVTSFEYVGAEEVEAVEEEAAEAEDVEVIAKGKKEEEEF
jgi:large subunit ribosomal protein L25